MAQSSLACAVHLTFCPQMAESTWPSVHRCLHRMRTSAVDRRLLRRPLIVVSGRREERESATKIKSLHNGKSLGGARIQIFICIPGHRIICGLCAWRAAEYRLRDLCLSAVTPVACDSGGRPVAARQRGGGGQIAGNVRMNGNSVPLPRHCALHLAQCKGGLMRTLGGVLPWQFAFKLCAHRGARATCHHHTQRRRDRRL